MVDISCPYLNLFADFVAWESCFKNHIASVPKGNLACSPSKLACVVSLLNHCKLVKGGVNLLISFCGEDTKIVWKPRIRSGTM